MLKPLCLALSVLLVTPIIAQASELVLIPSVSLRIGDQGYDGRYWDGRYWRDRAWWHDHYRWHDRGWRPYYVEYRDYPGYRGHHDNGRRGYDDDFPGRGRGHGHGHWKH